jgi:hypothetical protein
VSTQRFVDALSGADGTQALRVRYEVPPVYPDGTGPIATAPSTTVRRVTVPRVAVRIPEIDPQVARAVAELAAADRPALRPARPGPPSEQRPSRPAAPSAPTRAQAARADFYQGSTPFAIAPAEPARHRGPTDARPPFPTLPTQTGSLSGQAERLRAQLGQFGRQFGTGNPRTPAPAPSSPQSGPRSSVPPSAFRPPVPQRRMRQRAGNAVQVAVALFIVLVLLGSLGSEVVRDVVGFFQR